MIAVAQWLRIWVLGVEVSSSNVGNIFQHYFLGTFYPVVTILLEYLNPAILHLYGFCFVTW